MFLFEKQCEASLQPTFRIGYNLHGIEILK